MDRMDVENCYTIPVKITGMTEYGVSFEALMAGTVAPPPEGADSISHSKELQPDRS